jgi:hypothetical protein
MTDCTDFGWLVNDTGQCFNNNITYDGNMYASDGAAFVRVNDCEGERPAGKREIELIEQIEARPLLTVRHTVRLLDILTYCANAREIDRCEDCDGTGACSCCDSEHKCSACDGYGSRREIVPGYIGAAHLNLALVWRCVSSIGVPTDYVEIRYSADTDDAAHSFVRFTCGRYAVTICELEEDIHPVLGRAARPKET